MRFLPKRRGVRIAAGGVVGLLVIGAAVGSSRLGTEGGDDRLSHADRSPQTTAVADGGSGVAFGGGASGGGMAGTQALPPAGVDDAASQSLAATGGPDAVVAEESFGSLSEGPVNASLPQADAGRVLKTASIELKVTKDGFDAARNLVLTAVDGAGGFVQHSNLENGRASLTLRVPEGRFDAVMKSLRDVGDVQNESIAGEDVSEEFVDLEGRLRHWRAQEAVFLDLMTKARTVTETIEVQRQLSTVQQNIEQIEGRKRFLENRTELATINLILSTPGAVAPKPEPDPGPSLSQAWDEAWDAAVEVVGGTLIVLGALVPLSVIVGGPIMLLVALRRRRGPGAPVPTPAG